MFKKVLCLAMALIMVAGMAVIGVSAADDTKIYFEVPSDWNNYTNIFCHVWEYNGNDLGNWQSKAERCTMEEERLYSYDLSKVGGLEAGKYYGVIFSADTGIQTYDLLMTTVCYGDTVYCDGTKFENPADSNKTAIAAYWRNQSPAQFGPIMGITSIGNVVGTCIAPGQTAESLFKNFIFNSETSDYGANFTSAKTYANKSEQEIIDDTATALGLSQAQVKAIIEATGLTYDWAMEESEAPEVANPVGGSSTGSGTGSGTVSGTVSTGQELTIVYIAIAMMIASAGVIFFARKKRVTE